MVHVVAWLVAGTATVAVFESRETVNGAAADGTSAKLV